MRYKSRAFTLVEMAIVLVIIGFILATTLPLLTERIGRDQITKGRRVTNNLKKEIIGYVLQNEYLPSLATVEGMSNSRDNWQNNMAYWSDPDLTDSGGTPPDLCTESPGGLSLQDDQSGQTYDDIAFVIASRGPNFNLQVGDDGATGPQTLTTYSPGYDDSNFNDFDHTATLGADYDVSPEREEDFDDIVEYVSYDYLYSQLDCPEGPEGAETSFASEPDAYDADTAAVTTDSEGRPTISKSPNGEVELQTSSGSSNGYGCLWYTGSAAACTTDAGNIGGLCSAPNGIRAYFEFNTKTGSDGGWTFTVLGQDDGDDLNDHNEDEDDFQLLCGGECGNHGYADTYSGSLGLYPPKIAIEFDYYQANGNNYNDDNLLTGANSYSSNNDYGAVAILFWGEEGVASSTLLDDVEHVDNSSAGGDGYGNFQDTNSAAQANYAGGDFFEPVSEAADPYDDDKWLDDGQTHQVRIEIHRNDDGDADTEDLQIYVWFDCTGAQCDNVGADYVPGGTDEYGFQIQREIADGVPEDLYAYLDDIRFGWTFGDCGGSSGHDTTISNFGLAFR